MKITITKVTENPDGSADAVVNFDAEGLGFLIQEGVTAILLQYIEQCRKEAKTKAKNARKKNTSN